MEEGTGAPLLENVVPILAGAIQEPLQADKLKDNLAQYKTPANCEFLVPPRVNPEIWRNLRHTTKARVVAFQHAQTRLGKSLTAIGRLIDTVLAAKKKPGSLKLEDILNLTFDAFSLEAGAFQELNTRRKHIRPELSRQ